MTLHKNETVDFDVGLNPWQAWQDQNMQSMYLFSCLFSVDCNLSVICILVAFEAINIVLHSLNYINCTEYLSNIPDI